MLTPCMCLFVQTWVLRTKLYATQVSELSSDRLVHAGSSSDAQMDQSGGAGHQRVKSSTEIREAQPAGHVFSPLYAAQSFSSPDLSAVGSTDTSPAQNSKSGLTDPDQSADIRTDCTSAAGTQGDSQAPGTAQSYPDTQLYQFADIELAHH